MKPSLAMKKEDVFTKWITEGFQFKMYSQDEEKIWQNLKVKHIFTYFEIGLNDFYS